jgi:hypothetical protein
MVARISSQRAFESKTAICRGVVAAFWSGSHAPFWHCVKVKWAIRAHVLSRTANIRVSLLANE